MVQEPSFDQLLAQLRCGDEAAAAQIFRREADGQFDLADWDSLWSLLTLLTLRKCRYQVRRFHTARRDIRRETAPPTLAEETHASWQAIAREPTAEEAVLLAETVEQLF